MCVEEHRSLGLAVKSVSNLLDRRMHTELSPGDRATPMQGHIVKYLYESRERGDLFQRDIEQRFSIRRSTATGILNLMERDGFLRRESVGYDARLKKLVLTDAAIEHHQRISRHIAENEARMAQGLSDEELDVFFSVMEKLRKNLE